MSSPLPKMLTPEWSKQLEHADVSELKSQWLPQVLANFEPEAFDEVWSGVYNHIAEIANDKKQRKIQSEISAILKKHSANLTEQDCRHIALRTGQWGGYKVMQTALTLMRQKNPASLSQWFDLEPPHTQVITMALAYGMLNNDLALINAVVPHLLPKAKNKLRLELMNNSAALHWQSLMLSPTNVGLQRMDELLDLVFKKIQSVFSSIEKYPIDQIYTHKNNLPWYDKWLKDTDKKFSKGTMLEDLFASRVFFARQNINILPKDPNGNKNDNKALATHEAFVAGRVLFLCRFENLLTTAQCNVVLKTIGHLQNNGVDVSFMDKHVAQVQARSDHDALQLAIPVPSLTRSKKM